MSVNLEFENKFWSKFDFIAGCDEVGRGALAGPVYVASVIFDKKISILDLPVRIDDSKKLTAIQREKASLWIKKYAYYYKTSSSTSKLIDKIGIVKATNIAFRKSLSKKTQFLLMDAFWLPFTKGLPKSKQMPIIKGDQKSISIAAASIIAKVERDKYMQIIGEKRKFRNYSFGIHKGYATANHIKAIEKFGLSSEHRVSFSRKIKASFAFSQAQ